MSYQITVLLVFGALVLGSMGLLAVVLRGRQRLQELAVQERIAMIERGLVPSPESDPAGFDRLLMRPRSPSSVAIRFQSIGVMIMGIGVAIGVLLSFVAQVPLLGLGVGAAIAVLGLTACLNGMLLASAPATSEPPRT